MEHQQVTLFTSKSERDKCDTFAFSPEGAKAARIPVNAQDLISKSLSKLFSNRFRVRTVWPLAMSVTSRLLLARRQSPPKRSRRDACCSFEQDAQVFPVPQADALGDCLERQVGAAQHLACSLYLH